MRVSCCHRVAVVESPEENEDDEKSSNASLVAIACVVYAESPEEDEENKKTQRKPLPTKTTMKSRS